MRSFRASLDRVWTVARRELAAMFNHPTGYVLLVVFLAANAFLFFRQAYFANVASLRPMLDLLPWVLLFFVPAVSMRLIAEETRTGMLEVVLTQPLTDLELLAGKYLGALVFLGLGLALTLPIPIGLSLGSSLHWGPIVAQYIGALLLMLGMSGVGVWASTQARSQITAFILAVAVTFVLVLVGLDPLIVGLGPTAGAIAARLGVLSHFQNIGRGVIDLRDAIYFLSLGGIFLALAYGALVNRRLSSTGPAVRRLRAGMTIMVVGLIVVNLAGGYIGGRLDLTPGKSYTLSRATRQIASQLDDIATIKVFASDELPTSVALLEREMDDLLRDLRSASHGKIRIVRQDPSTSDAARREAQSLGIGPIQFNVIGQAELSVKEGYLGLAVQYGAKHETIPFVNRGDDLEYRLAAALRSLSRTSKPVLGIIDLNQDPSAGGLDAVRQELEKSYEVRVLSLGDSTQPAADVSTLLLAGAPDSLAPDAADRLRKFFHRGGAALVLAGGTTVSPQLPTALPRHGGWNAALESFGLHVKNDLVYDLASSEVVPVGTSLGVRVLQRYPFFVRAQSTGQSVVNADLDGVLVPWPSSIDTTAGGTWTVTPLLVTSAGSGAIAGETTIEPTRDFPRDSLASRLVAVQVAPRSASDTSARGRVIVIASDQVGRGSFAERIPQNAALVLNAIDWLAQDESLIAIRARNTQPPPLAFESAVTRAGVKYMNLIGVPALTALFGLARLLRRRRAATRAGHRGAQTRAGTPEREEALA